MDTRSWKVVAELRRTTNITHAADRLAMTQPALSKRLQLIERELGTRLVERTSKGITFTPQGEYVAQEAEKALAHLAEMRRTLLTFQDHRTGTIRLGMTNSFVRYTLPSHLRAYKAEHPNVDFNVSTGVSSEIADRLEHGDIQVGFICGDISGNFSRLKIGTEQACLVNSESLRLEDLPNRPQISYLSDPFATRMLDEWWSGHFDRPPKIGMRANHGDTCLEMIANGLGYGIFLSPKFLDENRPLFRMPLFHNDGRPLSRSLWMIWKEKQAEPSLVQRFLGFFSDRFANAVEPTTSGDFSSEGS
ncbi:LysR family transcriptional regulator [Neorhizobium alkalisoli]|uniref:DNA-binding transcriptional LysR family regulator n=1 Tax=Neorhizobium alkalisoli TaxID=528178 RepID=A0A561R992_9HYPH|nr:LysR family transcriptional regulator [Neorhizobium alkalisoli]TWF59178.1 DNA-binding transcriptional LysR family regulator [Neorhizobium alkalisoli]